jgi:hypothetical protein
MIALQLAATALLLAANDSTGVSGTGAGPTLVAARVAVARVADASVPDAPVATALLSGASASDTTLRRRERAVEVSDAYELRLRIHRYASYTMIPLFAAQSIAGNQLYQSGGSDPAWAKSLHGFGAGGLAALFTVNTVTGVWNLWESRGVSQGRTARLVHSTLMLASDAGFTYAGVKLGPDATRLVEKRREHRRLALISMSSALAGYATMLVANH